MRTYKVVISKRAQNDLRQLKSYISDMLMNPQAAARIYRAIRDQVSSLASMPNRYAVVFDEPPFETLGIRLMPVESYNVFYTIRENSVDVLRIIYDRRDWVPLIKGY